MTVPQILVHENDFLTPCCTASAELPRIPLITYCDMLRLLNLPADLRLMIWELVIPQDEVVSLGLGKPTRSCDRLAAPKECSLQFYKEGISGPSQYFPCND